MMTWVICGAGRGVGKTHLARELCRVLPRSVYAKSGCGKAVATKQPNFFPTQKALTTFLESSREAHDHAVVESNALARAGAADVIIFLGPREETADLRPDAKKLRRHAHLAVCPGVSIRDWRKVLKQKLITGKLREKICDLLTDQKRHLARGGAEVRSKIWFTVGDMHVFGVGLAELLCAVAECGTLSAAASATGMSYRYAWNLLKRAEKHLGRKLIIPHAGGVGGGCSVLSPEGERLTDAFDRLNREVAEFADRRFAELYRTRKAKPKGRRHDSS